MTTPTLVLLAARAAHGPIFQETVSTELETGGLLVGRRIRYQGQPLLVILAATGPGHNADRRPLYYGSDRDYLQQELEFWREKLSQYDVDYIGEWHKHPEEVPQPSTGDRKQIQRILNDPSYKLTHGDLLIPITLVKSGNFELHAYYVSRVNLEPQELPYEVVEDDELATFVEECLRVPTDVHPDTKGDKWKATGLPQVARLMPIEEYPSPANVIEGEFIVISAEEYSTDTSDTPVEPPTATMVQIRLEREINRLERLAQRFGFTIDFPGGESDYIELNFDPPLPLSRTLVRASASASVTPKNASEEPSNQTDMPSEPVATGPPSLEAIHIVYPDGYPLGIPIIRVKVDGRMGAVKSRSLMRGSPTLDLLVERLLSWLLTAKPQHLAELLVTNLGHSFRKAVHHISIDVITSAGDLARYLDKNFNRDWDFETKRRKSPVQSDAGKE